MLNQAFKNRLLNLTFSFPAVEFLGSVVVIIPLVTREFGVQFCAGETVNRSISLVLVLNFGTKMRRGIRWNSLVDTNLVLFLVESHYNQSINQSIFIPPKIKRHTLSCIFSCKSKKYVKQQCTNNRKIENYI